jgi:hypothetical protein
MVAAARRAAMVAALLVAAVAGSRADCSASSAVVWFSGDAAEYNAWFDDLQNRGYRPTYVTFYPGRTMVYVNAAMIEQPAGRMGDWGYGQNEETWGDDWQEEGICYTFISAHTNAGTHYFTWLSEPCAVMQQGAVHMSADDFQGRNDALYSQGYVLRTFAGYGGD